MREDVRIQQWQRDLAQPHRHPGPADLDQFGTQALAWVVQHFTTLPEQSIGETASRAHMEGLLGEPAPETGQAFARVFAEFREKIAPFAFRVDHPRFLAFVPGAPTFWSILGDLLCAGSNFFAGVWLEAAGPAQVECVVLDWFRAFLDYPPEARGLLTSGGSEANLTALLAAREPLSFEERSQAVLYVTQERHGSVDRAARVIGFRPEQVRPIPTDERFRMRPEALAEAVRHDCASGLLPWAVVANAGATNTGAVDPLESLADLCAEQHLWLHVDGAYGWPAVLTPEGKECLRGISRADSITLDPHKWFGQTFDVGCVLVREGRRLRDCFAMRPDYMQDVAPAEDEINFADYGLALTRRFRALKIWLSVKLLGVAWYRELVTRCCRLADLAQALLEYSGEFEILSPRQLSIVCFRYRPPEMPESMLDRLNLALIDAVRATGRAFLSSTRLQSRVALRFCFINWRTTAADVEEVVRLLADKGRTLAVREEG